VGTIQLGEAVHLSLTTSESSDAMTGVIKAMIDL
jgi:hypothetical protein